MANTWPMRMSEEFTSSLFTVVKRRAFPNPRLSRAVEWTGMWVRGFLIAPGLSQLRVHRKNSFRLDSTPVFGRFLFLEGYRENFVMMRLRNLCPQMVL